MSDAVRFPVRVTPRAAVDRVEGVNEEGELLVRVRAAPAGGAANLAALRTIAAAADVALNRVRLERGATGRHKLVAIDDVDGSLLARRWPRLAVSRVR